MSHFARGFAVASRPACFQAWVMALIALVVVVAPRPSSGAAISSITYDFTGYAEVHGGAFASSTRDLQPGVITYVAPPGGNENGCINGTLSNPCGALFIPELYLDLAGAPTSNPGFLWSHLTIPSLTVWLLTADPFATKSMQVRVPDQCLTGGTLLCQAGLTGSWALWTGGVTRPLPFEPPDHGPGQIAATYPPRFTVKLWRDFNNTNSSADPVMITLNFALGNEVRTYVPEPSTGALTISGLLGLSGYAARRRARRRNRRA